MKTTGILSLALSSSLALLAAAGWAAQEKTPSLNKATPQQAAFFETKVRPVLFANCFSCHGENAPKAGLRLDTAAGMVRGGARGAAVVPGDPGKSLLLKAIRHEGPQMPPNRKLKDEEIAAIAQWVKDGAPWPEEKPVNTGKEFVITEKQRQFWSFKSPVKPTPPAVKNAAWAKSPIDRFVLAGLEAKGLAPAPQADRRSLIRRAYFDLIGLPPTPEEVEAFVADKSPDAFGKVIDRLLADKHFGERWGRHWLDVARYADSNGLDENLAFGHAWKYRDYVIGAFNKDKPYDQFIAEQIAGDLLPSDNPKVRDERITATGFLVLGPKVLAEQDKPKLVMDIVDEQIEVTSKAVMGLTVACARCHDHKFDPIATKDYYALAGIFKSTKSMANLGFVSRWNERQLSAPLDPEYERALQAKIASAEGSLNAAYAAASAALKTELEQNREKVLRAAWELSRQPGMVSLAEAKPQPGDPERLFIEAENFTKGEGVVKDFQTYGKGIGVIHNVQTPNRIEWEMTVPTAGFYQVEIRYASGDPRAVKLLLNGKTLRDNTAGAVTGGFGPEAQKWEIQGVFPFEAGKNTLKIEKTNGPIPHFDKLLVAAAKAPPGGGSAAPKTAEQVAKEFGVRAELVKFFAGSVAKAATADEALNVKLDAPERALDLYAKDQKAAVERANKAVADSRAEANEARMVMAVEEDKVQNVKVHIRGDTQNLGPEVPRGFVQVVSVSKAPAVPENRSGRLELAEWLTRPDHPLTGRVHVNRLWQQLFGEGLVRTPDSWGLLGEKPTHPELLDWLAVTFIEQGWSTKKMLKTIMLSSAYQMSAAANPKAELADPDNRLWWRMNRRRLQAEPFRDAMLAVSGQLDRTMGGTFLSTKNGDYVTNDQSGNGARYNVPRRSIYLPIIRNAMYDMFQAFDVGDPSIVNAKRPSTTVAPQALWVMNSPFALEQSKVLAADLMKSAATDEARMRTAYLRMFARPATAEETSRNLRFLVAYAEKLAPKAPDAAKRQEAAWAALAQALFASNEFIYLN